MNDAHKAEQSSIRTPLSDEVLRKVGRNVVIFQQIEALLKHIVVRHRVEGKLADIAECRHQRVEEHQNKTMGTLVKNYTDGILSDAGDPAQDPVDLTQAWISIAFTTSVSSDLNESLRTDMKVMTDERNDLVHHFLPRWQPDSVETLTAAASYLDAQREKVLPIFEHLKSVAKSMETAGALLASDDMKRELKLLWLQHSPLVTILREVAVQKARSDGWTYLTTGANFARIHEPDAVKNIEERYGYSTLKQLLVGSKLFDVFDEPLPSGGFRTLYRIKL